MPRKASRGKIASQEHRTPAEGRETPSRQQYVVGIAGSFEPILPKCLLKDPEVFELWKKTSTQFPSFLRKVSPEDILRGLALPMNLVRDALLNKSERKLKKFESKERDIVVVLKGQEAMLDGYWRFLNPRAKSGPFKPVLEGGWAELQRNGLILEGDTLLVEVVADAGIIGIKTLLRASREHDLPNIDSCTSSCTPHGKKDAIAEIVPLSPHAKDFPFHSPENEGTYSGIPFGLEDFSVGSAGHLPDVEDIGTSFFKKLKKEDFEAESFLRLDKNFLKSVEAQFGTCLETNVEVENSKGEVFPGTIGVGADGDIIVLGCLQMVLNSENANPEDTVLCQLVKSGTLRIERI